MKKLVALLLIAIQMGSLYACSGNSNIESSQSSQESEVAALTSEDLEEAVGYIMDAESSIISASSLQLEGWSKYADIMQYYFDDSNEEDPGVTEIRVRAINIREYRAAAKENLDKAKEVLGTNGTGDYYDAVKEYYKTVNKFFNLISTFPEGYSKLTFSSAVSEYKSECQDAYGELEFYK